MSLTLVSFNKFIIIIIFCVVLVESSQSRSLPVYVEDNHGGSFFWIVRNLDFQKKYTLLLFDAHSDATAVLSSDYLRNEIQKKFSDDSYDNLLQTWRKKGYVQSYNWIEPLMPWLIDNVIWIHPFSEKRNQKLKKDIKKQINSFTEIYGRKVRDLSQRYKPLALKNLSNMRRFAKPVIASIDLDTFAHMNLSQSKRAMRKIINYLMGLDNLEALTVAISRPYLKSQKQANELLYFFLDKIYQCTQVKVEINPFDIIIPDSSLMAMEYRKSKKIMPKYNFINLSQALKNLFLIQRKNLFVRHKKKWSYYYAKWKNEITIPEIEVYINSKKIYSNDLTYYKNDIVKLIATRVHSDSKITWYVYESYHRQYNLLNNREIFAKKAPQFIYNMRKKIGQGNELLLKNYYFRSSLHTGTIRIFALINHNNNEYRTRTLTVSRTLGKDYISRILELYNQPYLFGSSMEYIKGINITDLRMGSDCANFLIYGKRRMGYKIPYGTPKTLLKYLSKYKKINNSVNGIYNYNNKVVFFNNKMIKNGLVLHFGIHVALLYEDSKPYGILNSRDLVIHHLEGYPEIIPLGKLKYTKDPFCIMKFKN